MILPSSKNTTLSATARANCISCVTITIVFPCAARFNITSRTSRTISGSRAAVTSSNSRISGCIHNARTIATLCFCPPDSSLGNLPACSCNPTFLRSFIASSVTSSFFRFCTFIGANRMLSNTVRCGNKS